MGARRLSVHKQRWLLRQPFRITGHVWNDAEVVTVEVEADGRVGLGEASGVYYTGETVDSMQDQIEAIRASIECGCSREELQALLPPGGARNAVDCALWDLEVQSSGRDIWSLTGVEHAPTTTVMTIPILDTPQQMHDEAKRLGQYPALKVKLDGIEPVERLRAVREARPDAELVVDANQGFSFDQLIAVLPAFEELGLAMLEQPLPRGEDAALEGFESPIPLCADESCLDLGELDQAADRYQMINIKLDKCGGLTEGLALAGAARERGMALMVGNMLGTSLAMLPGLVIAQYCSFVDLDGPLHLIDDHLPSLRFDDGLIVAPEFPVWGSVRGR